ncbi:MAG: hypothetical protein ACRCTP_04860 [Aeromonas popoffii]|uniref:phage nozzle protein n=1 Tax=Aeromonas popoffii TaxID=70856 RepID=UPI003F3C7752
MKVVTGTLGRPIQGLSQQPNNVRIEGQCSQSINMTPDIVKGLTSRAGFFEVNSITLQVTEFDKIHYYKRSEGEEYFIIVSADKNESIKVVNPRGDIQDIEIDQAALDYLYRHDNNVRELEFKTVGDYTFIANNKVEVEPSPFKSDPLKNEAVIYCQFIDYAQTHKVYSGDTLLAEYSSMDGTDNSDPKQKESVKTSKVIDALVASINGGESGDIKEQSTAASSHSVSAGIYILRAPVGNLTNIVVTKVYNQRTGKFVSWDSFDGSFIIWNSTTRSDIKAGDGLTFSYYDKSTSTSGSREFIAEKAEDSNTFTLRRLDGKDFDIRTVDDADGKNLISIKGNIEDPSLLPNEAPIGMKVQIYPKGAKPEETYWLEATQPLTKSTLIWKECVAPDTNIGMDNTSLPVTLIREDKVNGMAKFKLKFNDWGNRVIGDATNNTDPSFVGGKIASIGLFQNRLFFTSGESISMSRSSEFFEFYKTTTQTVVATDPYDAYSDTEDVISLAASIGFDGDLILFSESSQHSISGESVVTPESPAPIRKLTAFDVQLTTKPVSSGENIFFGFDFGQFTGIREFFTDSIADTKRARPVTDHVNQLIRGRLRLMKSSSSLNKLICQGSDLSTLYVYDWLWQGSDKVQSAWGIWKLQEGDKILHYELVDSYMYMIVSRNGVVLFMAADLGDPPEGSGLDFAVRLDNKKIVKATLDTSTNQWIIPNHLQNYQVEDIRVISAEGVWENDKGSEMQLNAGFPLSVENLNIAPDGVTEITVVVGTPFKATYTPSNPFPRDSDGKARSDLDRLQMSKLIYNFDMAGPCTGKVEMIGYRTFEYPLTPRVLGSRSNIVGFALLTEGSFTVPIRTRSNRYLSTIETTSHIPLRIRGVEYQGTYQRK